MKTYLGISRDHSLSMSRIAAAAGRDYNATVRATQNASRTNDIDTVVSVVRCGGGVHKDITNSSVMALTEMQRYETPGHNTPLFDSVVELIEQFKRVPDYNDPEVTFIVMATTDGEDNASRTSGRALNKMMDQLIATDRWTFVFRVPNGYARSLTKLGINGGNILEWDATSTRGQEAATQANEVALTQFYTDRKAGVKSSKTFYTSLKDVTAADVKAVLKDISGEVQLFPVAAKDEGKQIRDYVEARLNGQAMAKGAAFYQLIKVEDKIQGYKLVAIRDKNTNAIYCGDAARDMLGLPRGQDARVRPEVSKDFDVFIQSTSVNRKVNAGTQIMYWPSVGVAFKEGVSAR